MNGHPTNGVAVYAAMQERSTLLAAIAAEGMKLTRLDLTAPIDLTGPEAVAPDVILLALDADSMALGEARAMELLADARFDDVPLLLLVPGGPEAPDAARAIGDAMEPMQAHGVEPERLARLLAEGAFDYLVPTFPVAILRSRLQAALRWRKRLRAATDTTGRTSQPDPNALPSLPPVPLTQRTLRVSGAVVRGTRRTGASFDVALDEFGRMTLFAFDAAWPEADAAMNSFAIRRAVREALDLGRPLDAVAADAVATLRSIGSESLGLVALRFSADSTTLEVLDCGFAPVFELEANGNLIPLAPPSERLGLTDSHRFSASMMSVRSGSVYIAM